MKVKNGKVQVTVHSLGSVDSPSTAIALLDSTGNVIARTQVPALKAPLDLKPKTAVVTLSIPKIKTLSGCRVMIDPERKINEITRGNNSVTIKEKG